MRRPHKNRTSRITVPEGVQPFFPASTERPEEPPMLNKVVSDGTDLNEFRLALLSPQLTDSNLIGQGYFAKVYRVNAGSHGQFSNVACKIFIDFHYTLTEYQATRQLSHGFHPNIVECFGVLVQRTVNGRMVTGLVLELMQHNLHDVLHRRKSVSDDFEVKITTRQKFKWAEQAAAALVFLHHRKVVHGKVKPSKMLLSDDLEVLKICETEMSRKTNTNNCSDVRYLAPEVLSGGSENIKTDVYSYAISTWEILNREIAFSEIEEKECPERILSGYRPALTQCPAPRHWQLSVLLKRCWHSDPARRLFMSQLLMFFSTNHEDLGEEDWGEEESQARTAPSSVGNCEPEYSVSSTLQENDELNQMFERCNLNVTELSESIGSVTDFFSHTSLSNDMNTMCGIDNNYSSDENLSDEQFEIEF